MSEPGPRSPRALRVMTYNIRGGLGMDRRRSIPRVAEVIRAADPDVAGLQEVHHLLPWSGFVGQPARLARQTGLRACFRPSFALGFGGYGNLCLTHLRLLECVRERLPGSREPRALITLKLELAGTPIRVLITHLGLGVEEKSAQARHLAERIGAEGTPTVLLGDLNAPPGSEVLRAVRGAGLDDALPPEAPTFPADAPAVRIDYVLASSHWQVDRWSIPATLASDHLPLVADLTLRK